MSTSYYLHSTDFAESVRIGLSAGDRWTTDASVTETCTGGRTWTATTELVAFLTAQAERVRPHPAWVADEYGRVYSPTAAVDVILAHREWRELDRSFG